MVVSEKSITEYKRFEEGSNILKINDLKYILMITYAHPYMNNDSLQNFANNIDENMCFCLLNVN